MRWRSIFSPNRVQDIVSVDAETGFSLGCSNLAFRLCNLMCFDVPNAKPNPAKITASHYCGGETEMVTVASWSVQAVRGIDKWASSATPTTYELSYLGKVGVCSYATSNPLSEFVTTTWKASTTMAWVGMTRLIVAPRCSLEYVGRDTMKRGCS